MAAQPQEAFFPRPQPLMDGGSFDTEQTEPVEIRAVTGVTRIGNEKVSLTYREPVNASDITDPVPLLIAHGWGAAELAYSNLGEKLAEGGKPSITYGEGRSFGFLNDLNPCHLLKVAEL